MLPSPTADTVRYAAFRKPLALCNNIYLLTSCLSGIEHWSWAKCGLIRRITLDSS